jgi:hypothetical protein
MYTPKLAFCIRNNSNRALVSIHFKSFFNSKKECFYKSTLKYKVLLD